MTSATISLSLFTGEEDPLSVTAVFSYYEADPYSVHVMFHVDGDEDTPWELSREVLAAGLKADAGVGDVKFWPRTDAYGKRVLMISLNSPDGLALLEAPMAEVEAFLEATYAVVPAGAEDMGFEPDLLDWAA